MERGSPTPGPQTGPGPRPVRNRATQQEVSGGRAREASSAAPHGAVEKLSSTKPAPAAKKVGDRCFRTPIPPEMGGLGGLKSPVKAESEHTGVPMHWTLPLMYTRCKQKAVWPSAQQPVSLSSILRKEIKTLKISDLCL